MSPLKFNLRDLGPEFSGKVKPVRTGYYLRRYPDGRRYYCYWDGMFWGIGRHEPVFPISTAHSGLQRLPWCGLMENAR